MTQEQQVIEMMRVGLFYAPACVAMQRAAFFESAFLILFSRIML